MSGLFYFKIRCMTAENIIVTVRNELIRAISGLDGWFDREDTVMNHKPSTGGWNIRELLEHVMLTNRFLLILIDKGSEKAIRHAHDGDFSNLLEDYCLENPVLAEVGIHRSFDWRRPDHMEPTGATSLSEVRREVREQLNRCLIHLELLKQGEGILYKTSMSVHGLGKLDVYQYIYFLALHVRRHLTQLEGLMDDYNNALENA